MKRLLAILFLCGVAATQAQSSWNVYWIPNPAGENTISYNIYEHVGTTYNLLGSVVVPATLSFSLLSLPTTSSHLISLTSVNSRGESLKSSDVLDASVATAPAGIRIGP